MLMSMRQCARYIGIPYGTLSNYWLYIQDDIPYITVGNVKLVNAEVVRARLLAEGYNLSGNTNRNVDESDVYYIPGIKWVGIGNGKKVDHCLDEDDVYYDREKIRAGIGTYETVVSDKSDLHRNQQAKMRVDSHGGQQADNEDWTDEDDAYYDPQTMLEDIESGKLSEDVDLWCM